MNFILCFVLGLGWLNAAQTDCPYLVRHIPWENTPVGYSVPRDVSPGWVQVGDFKTVTRQ